MTQKTRHCNCFTVPISFLSWHRSTFGWVVAVFYNSIFHRTYKENKEIQSWTLLYLACFILHFHSHLCRASFQPCHILTGADKAGDDPRFQLGMTCLSAFFSAVEWFESRALPGKRDKCTENEITILKGQGSADFAALRATKIKARATFHLNGILHAYF